MKQSSVGVLREADNDFNMESTYTTIGSTLCWCIIVAVEGLDLESLRDIPISYDLVTCPNEVNSC